MNEPESWWDIVWLTLFALFLFGTLFYALPIILEGVATL